MLFLFRVFVAITISTRLNKYIDDKINNQVRTSITRWRKSGFNNLLYRRRENEDNKFSFVLRNNFQLHTRLELEMKNNSNIRNVISLYSYLPQQPVSSVTTVAFYEGTRETISRSNY